MSPKERQRRTALARANEIRLGRAEVKRRIVEGRTSIPVALHEPCVASMPVGDLLAAQRYWGPVRVRRLMVRLSRRGLVLSGRRIGDLSRVEREALCAELAR